MKKLTRQQLINLIKKRPLHLRNCVICDAKLYFSYKGDQLYWHSACNCTTYTSKAPPETRSDYCLDFYLEQHFYQKHFQEYYREELATET